MAKRSSTDEIFEQAAQLDVLQRTMHDLGRPDLSEAARKGALALRELGNIYNDHQLWDVYASSGADDAARLYNLLGWVGLEVA